MTAKTSFRGSFTALVTPFKNGALDEKAFRDIVEWQISEGTNGLVPVGTTGESPTLSHDEHKKVVEWCIDQADGRVPVIAGSGSNSTAEAIELSRHAEEAGADAVLIVTPYYNKPTQEGLYQHYKAINDAIGIPIIIYNIPGRSIVDMSVETMTRLFQRVAAARCDGTGLQSALGRGHHCARLHGARRPRLHLGHIECRAAPVRRIPGGLPERRLQGRAQAAGQTRTAAHRSVRRNESGADQVRNVTHRQMHQHGAAANGAGNRERAGGSPSGDGARRADQLAA
jgi:hypothetical protein